MGEEKGPLPYYKWLWRDFRASRKVSRMSYIERGLYRELLDECWDKGSIPDNIGELADICGCPLDVMASAWQVLSKCFEQSENGLINEKLNSLRTASDMLRVKRAKSGREGAIAKSQTVVSVAKSGNSLASAKQVPYSRAEQSRAENNKHLALVPPSPTCPHQEIIAAYHELLPTGTKIKIWNETRKRTLQARWRESETHQSIEFWRRLFKWIATSPFLTGQISPSPGHKQFVVALDWITNPTNFAKIIEGKYHGGAV